MIPDKDQIFPLKNYERLCFLKNIITRPNIQVGDYTYYDDFEDVYNFEKNVKYHFEFTGDHLVIGKFCMIASDVTFIMNGANHLTESVSAYPFAIFGGDWQQAMEGKTYPTKGDTTVGHDVWLGYKATIMPGLTIGNGAIIAAHSLVTKDVAPYTIVGGNPAKVIKQRFSDAVVYKLQNAEWWHWPLEKITKHIQQLTSEDFSFLD